MPIQEETVAGRPGAVDAGIEGEAGLSPRIRRYLGQQEGYMGQWKDYNEEERQVLQKYQSGFSAALQAQSGVMGSYSTEMLGHLNKFKRQYNKYVKYKQKSRHRDTWEYKKVRSDKKKYRAARKETERALDKAERLYASTSFQKIKAQPPEMQAAPGAPGVPSILFATGLRSESSPQIKATTGRAGRPHSESGLTDILEERQAFYKATQPVRAFQNEAIQTRLGAIQTRLGLAEQHGELAGKQEESYLALQAKARKNIDRAREFDMHESHGGGYLGWEL